MAAILILILVLVVSGCGGEDSGEARSSGRDSTTAAATTPRPVAATSAGTRITLRDSRFGPMLWGPGRQAIYIFERDGRNRSRCHGECARAWPPVYTKGSPVAGNGVKRSLLGSIRRRGGRRQVTYAGKPLYYYVNEGPDQVLCHDVVLNGGSWWVVGADGKRRP